jgi:hypothetical protein
LRMRCWRRVMMASTGSGPTMPGVQNGAVEDLLGSESALRTGARLASAERSNVPRMGILRLAPSIPKARIGAVQTVPSAVGTVSFGRISPVPGVTRLHGDPSQFGFDPTSQCPYNSVLFGGARRCSVVEAVGSTCIRVAERGSVRECGMSFKLLVRGSRPRRPTRVLVGGDVCDNLLRTIGVPLL